MNTNSNGLQSTGRDSQTSQSNRRSLANHVDHYEFLRTPAHKQIVLGTGAFNSKDGMFVSIGRKFDAFCPNAEIADAKIGEPCLFIVTSSSNEESMPTVSRKQTIVWEELASLQQSGDVTFVKVTKIARDIRHDITGLSVEFVDGHASGFTGHISKDCFRGAELKSLIGTLLPAVVTRVDQTRGQSGLINLSYSKAFQINTSEAVACVGVGEELPGRVLKFISAGKGDEHPSVLVIVEKEGLQITGMIHATEVAGYPQQKATDFLKVGDTISARVLRASTARQSLVLGLRSKERAQFLAGVEPGFIVSGKVTRSKPFGYFVDLGHGIEGLIRDHQLLRINKKNETFQIGDEINVIILENDEVKGRLLLGRRGLKPEHLTKG